jgi:hypothetical protein
MPVIEHPVFPCGQEPGTQHDVGFAGYERPQEPFEIGWIVLEVRILNADKISRCFRKPCSQGGSFALVLSVSEYYHLFGIFL